MMSDAVDIMMEMNQEEYDAKKKAVQDILFSNDNISVIATAAVEAFLTINPNDWQLSTKTRP